MRAFGTLTATVLVFSLAGCGSTPPAPVGVDGKVLRAAPKAKTLRHEHSLRLKTPIDLNEVDDVLKAIAIPGYTQAGYDARRLKVRYFNPTDSSVTTPCIIRLRQAVELGRSCVRSKVTARIRSGKDAMKAFKANKTTPPHACSDRIKPPEWDSKLEYDTRGLDMGSKLIPSASLSLERYRLMPDPSSYTAAELAMDVAWAPRCALAPTARLHDGDRCVIAHTVDIDFTPNRTTRGHGAYGDKLTLTRTRWVHGGKDVLVEVSLRVRAGDARDLVSKHVLPALGGASRINPDPASKTEFFAGLPTGRCAVAPTK